MPFISSFFCVCGSPWYQCNDTFRCDVCGLRCSKQCEDICAHNEHTPYYGSEALGSFFH